MILKEPKSIFSEAIRSIRTEIFLVLNRSDSLKTILITGSSTGEGKTTVATNLAISMAQKGNKTLIVDNDLRRPNLHRVLNVEKFQGLSEYLTDSLSLDVIIKDADIENLNVITSGQIPPNPSEIISSAKMDEFINEVKERFDVIIFDAPPITSITDSIILADKLDTSIQVIRSGKEFIPVAKNAKERLTLAKAKHLGAILNGFTATQGSYYDRYYRYDEKKKNKQ